MIFTTNFSDIIYEGRNIIGMFFMGRKVFVNPEQVVDGDRADINVNISGDMVHCEITLELDRNLAVKTLECAADDDTLGHKLDITRLLYEMLCDATGKSFSWGLLTGIRPVKLVEKFFGRGYVKKEIVEIFRDKYKAETEKIELLFETFIHESETIRRSGEDSYSLYIAIPFCKTRCSYCSFVSHAIEKAGHLIDDYVINLCDELVKTASIAYDLNLKLETIYIGGGTPTILSSIQLKKLVKTIADNFFVSEALEYTCEAGRPDTIDREKLEILKEYGVTRISINPQSTNDEVLKLIGRSHSAKEFFDCYAEAKDVGFKCINTDLIAGLTGESKESYLETLKDVIGLGPENITVHTLTAKRGANMETSDTAKSMATTDLCDVISTGAKMLRDAGYIPYYMYRQKNTLGGLENVGYSKPSYEGLYNIFIMNETHSILGAGSGAVTKLKEPSGNRIERIFSYKYPYEYINGFEEIIKRKSGITHFYNKFRRKK